MLIGVVCLACTVARADIVFFVDNPNRDQRLDTSWGYSQTPSTVEVEAQKFPVTSERAFNGRDSLRLHWTSLTNGDWGACIGTPGWLWHDATGGDAIRFKINGPEAIAKEALPNIGIEDRWNHKSDKLWIGQYFDGVDDDPKTWQDVIIPLADIKPGVQNTEIKSIKSIYFFQFAQDGVEHLAWIDDVRISVPGTPPPTAPSAPVNVVAVGRDGRIDIRWMPNAEADILGYNIYRAAETNSKFYPQNVAIHDPAVFSDDVGSNGVSYIYHVTAVNQEFQESAPSAPVAATSSSMSDKELITYAQEAAFHYFYEYGHPVSGLARERKGSADICTIGGTGFGLMTLMVGAERGFVTRGEAAARIVKIARFLDTKAQRYHGAFAHWIHGATGETVPFSEWDDGGDLVETSYLIQGLLACRKYFDQDGSDEKELRELATRIWESVEWDWYGRTPVSTTLYWHWSTNYGWRMDYPIQGFNEAQVTYILAIASPSHPVPSTFYYDGWAGATNYANGNAYYAHTIAVGPELGGPLFYTHNSYLGFDPRNKRDKFCNYFENNQNIVTVNRAYCRENPKGFKGYSDVVWGLSACDNPYGYGAHQPKKNDNGTLAPSAVLSSMPYLPKETIVSLRHLYRKYGSKIWGEFGFRSGMNVSEDWYAKSYLAIELGPVAPMIENTRSGLCWKMFMANDEIGNAVRAIGFTQDK
jgi:hypothetical protein